MKKTIFSCQLGLPAVGWWDHHICVQVYGRHGLLRANFWYQMGITPKFTKINRHATFVLFKQIVCFKLNHVVEKTRYEEKQCSHVNLGYQQWVGGITKFASSDAPQNKVVGEEVST